MAECGEFIPADQNLGNGDVSGVSTYSELPVLAQQSNFVSDLTPVMFASDWK
eukprot:m.156080 g.156080  ORF g.156080 m.156080 type:complete len:52 (+) comp14427_c0_seq1:1470-1625(+)